MHKEHKLHIKVAGATGDWIRVKKVGPSTPKMTLRPDMSDVSICDDKYSFFELLSLTNSIQKAPITLSSRQMKLKNSFDIQRINCYRIYGLSSFH